jgi:hypothetical protein
MGSGSGGQAAAACRAFVAMAGLLWGGDEERSRFREGSRV